MTVQHPHQPQALVGNPVSDAYYGGLRQRSGAQRPTRCAGCGTVLGGTRLTDGVTAWCGAGCQQAQVRRARDAALARGLVERGWTEERWRAARAAERE